MQMLSWLFNFVPWWLYVIVALVVIATCWQFIGPLWLLLPKSVKYILVLVGLLFVAYVGGRNRGSKDERLRNQERDTNANFTRDKIHAQIENMDRAAIDRKLAKWMRD